MSRAEAFRLKSIARVAIVVFLVLILVAEVLLYTPSLSGQMTATVELNIVGGYIDGNATFHAPVAAHVLRTVFLVSTYVPVQTLYFYFDTGYPYSFSNPIDWYGLSTHIFTVSGFRGNPINVVILNAAQLSEYLRSPPTTGAVLVVASGVLPDTVFTKSTNLLSPWIASGGTLVWLGDTIGTYSGSPGVPLQYPSPANPGVNGTNQFINWTLFGGSSSFYNETSSVAQAFDLNYTFGAPGHGLNVTRLPLFNGTVLGNLDRGYTNLATVPLGAGHIVDFLGPTLDATNLGLVVTNLLETGIFTGRFVLVNTTTASMTASSTLTIPIHFAVPYYPYGSGPVLACAFVAQTDYLALFGQTTCVNVP